MSLKDRTIREIEAALRKKGAFDGGTKAAGLGLHESYRVSTNKVIVYTHLEGMGHNEMDFGHKTYHFTEQQLFPEVSS